MSDFFEKISTLINAQMNDVLGRNPRSPLARIKLDAEDAEKNPRRSARSLRQRLDEAVEYEKTLEAKIDSLMQEVLELDEQVDALMGAGDTVGARRVQGQLNMKQQQLTFAESELRDHHLLTRHLIQELGTLEAALDTQERRPASAPSPSRRPPQRQRIPVEGLSPPPPAERRRYEKFDIVDEAPDPRRAKPRKTDAKDMQRRLSRLSKPGDADS